MIGSGSTYVYGYCDATYREGWSEQETVQFVKNSTSPVYQYLEGTDPSPGTSNGSRRFIRRYNPNVCHYKRQGRKAFRPWKRITKVLGRKGDYWPSCSSSDCWCIDQKKR